MVAIGNRIENFIGLNADNRGWVIFDKATNQTIEINLPDLFGGDKGEGGFEGNIDIHLGADNQTRNEYLATKMSALVSAYPNLSYLVYRGKTNDQAFHIVSMSGMMKEVLYWVSRIHVKNNGSVQWLDSKAEIKSMINSAQVSNVLENYQAGYLLTVTGKTTYSNSQTREVTDWSPSVALDYLIFNNQLADVGSVWSDTSDPNKFYGTCTGLAKVNFDVDAHHRVMVQFHTDGGSDHPYTPQFNPSSDGQILSISNENDQSENITLHTYIIDFTGKELIVTLSVAPHSLGGDVQSNRIFPLSLTVYYSDYKSDVYENAKDINPIHKIREILTDDTAMNKPESDVNDVNFTAAANRIYEEGLGISWAIQEKSCKEAIDELLNHIEAGIRVNRQTGKYEVVLFRDDLLNLDTALEFNASNIKEFQPEVANADDLINVLNIKFYDRNLIKESSFSVYENGNILSNGGQQITEDISFPYFMNRRNAELVANWKLKQLSTPVWKGSFTTGKYEARRLNRYDVVRLTWLDLGITDLPVRIMKIGLGDGKDNTVTLDFIEVIPYSNFDYQMINVDPSNNEVLQPKPNVGFALEMPYFEAVQNFGQTQTDAELANNPDHGYLLVAAKKPQTNSINALLFTDSGAGFAQQKIVNYAPNLLLDQDIGYLDTSFSVKNVDSISSVEVGSCLVVDNEIMVYQSYNSTTKILTVKRAALDTHPEIHTANAMAFFYDAFAAYDTTQYVDGEVVQARIRTTTPTSILPIEQAQALTIAFNARAYRPYPPNNIKINDTYYLESLVVSNDVVVTWVDRNRLQQTGGSILGWVDSTVTRESGVTYSIDLSVDGVSIASLSGITTNSHTFDHSILIPNKAHKLKLWSVRDGYESYQIFEHSFFGESVSLILTATVSKDKVVGSTVSSAAINVNVDETLGANLKFDGSSISGKAQAGASITIEVDE